MTFEYTGKTYNSKKLKYLENILRSKNSTSELNHRTINCTSFALFSQNEKQNNTV